jgi:ubiquinone/menaquinone biosynthesis C-methylase UbiE
MIAGKTAYDVADHYDESYFADLSERYRKRNRFARQRIANVFSLLPEVRDLRVVDIGCGMGTFTFEAASRGARYALGVDLAASGIAAAQRLAREQGIARCSFLLADAATLPVKTATADVAIAADFTEHLDDETLRRVFAEAARIVKPGGRLIIYTPEASHLFEQLRERGILLEQEPSHIGIRSAGLLAQFAQQAGFNVERTTYLPSHLPGWNILERAFGRWVPLLRRRIGLVVRKTA